jgi:hypothetical protein
VAKEEVMSVEFVGFVSGELMNKESEVRLIGKYVKEEGGQPLTECRFMLNIVIYNKF